MLPLFDQYAPDRSAALRAKMASLAPDTPDDAKMPGNNAVTEGLVPDNPNRDRIQDTLGRLDPKTGEVIEYPYPHSEISMREFFVDTKGRMWYASSVNNKIGYFYFNEDADAAK